MSQLVVMVSKEIAEKLAFPPNVQVRVGDTRLMWDRHNADEAAAARTLFGDLQKKGFMAYAVKAGGEKGELLRDFDVAAEKIIMAPPVRGG